MAEQYSHSTKGKMSSDGEFLLFNVICALLYFNSSCI